MILMTGEFSFVIGNWTGQFDELITSDLYNLLPNPDKNDEADLDSSTFSKTSVGRVLLLFSSVWQPDETLAQNSYASFVLSKLPACSISRHTHADV